MAILKTIHCITCGQTKQEARSISDYSDRCYQCMGEEKNRKEREWKSGREGLTIEERLRDLENFMYHHSKQDHSSAPMIFG